MSMTPHRTTSDLDDLINDVRLEVPGAMEDLIEKHMRRAIIEFCEISHFWHEEVGPIIVIDDIDRYLLTSSSYSRIGSVLEVTTMLNGNEIHLTETEDEGVKYRYQCPSPFEIVVHPVDWLKGLSLSVVCSIVPVVYQDSLEVSEEVVIRHRDALVDGATARLMEIPGKEWTNERRAMQLRAKFEQAAHRGLREQARSYKLKPDGGKPFKPRSFM